MSKSIHSYKDVRLVLDAALAAAGGIYTLPTPGKAVHWRMRAYMFRKLLSENAAARSIIPGVDTTTPYDMLDLIIEPKGSCSVIIRPVMVKGTLATLDGTPLDPTNRPQAEEHMDELSAEALDLLSRKGRD